MATFQKQVTYASINEKLKRSGLTLRGGFTQEDQTTLGLDSSLEGEL